MLHNFEKSLEYERNQAVEANMFYKKVLGASNTVRFNTDTSTDMQMQLQDVDVQLVIKGVTYLISEKFRDKDFGDLYVEIFSKYPYSPGWIYAHLPNALLYFTPNHVYWITHKSLADFCFNTLLPTVPEKWFEELAKYPKPILPKTVSINQDFVQLYFIKAPNVAADGAHWETIGLTIPFTVLEKNGVKFQLFERK